MRIGILSLTLAAALFGGLFWYGHMDVSCDAPIRYRIGAIDSRFGLTAAEAADIVHAAEAVWETPLSTELFIYDEHADLPVNFIFDERQERSNDEQELREDLENKEGISASVAEQYDALVKEFEDLKEQYESRAATYDTELKAYNKEVSDWNDRGGAPQDVREDLEARAAELKDEQNELEKFAKRLNSIIDELNRIGARGNSLIADYNTTVAEYNDQFAHTDEFAQGDYTGDAINIYEFESTEELTIVVAHELGHALSLGHVAGEDSIMYREMGKQSLKAGITPEDRAEYARLCTDRGALTSLMRWIRAFFRS
jgi:hypothetical protein